MNSLADIPIPGSAEIDREIADCTQAAEQLGNWLQRREQTFVLTGAGISTASGIPDYRGADGQWKRHPPITFQAFTQNPRQRARYWARSFVGWPIVAMAQPNVGHLALAAIASGSRLSALVTQNVDGLHTRAGHPDVMDLHGRIDQVVCMDCSRLYARDAIQTQLAERHPDWCLRIASSAPDGDADLDTVDVSSFVEPTCPACNGMLKPDVVFFGENVPRQRVQDAITLLQNSDSVLVVGSSLMVYSGFRFARMASEMGLPIAILTRGTTRADSLATLKLDARCETTLATVAGNS